MKKEWLVAAVILAFMLTSAYAANETAFARNSLPSSSKISSQSESNLIDKAYQCLNNQLTNKTSLSLPEAIFGMLALGSKGNLLENIQTAKHDREACWPKQSCKIKDTAEVLLAYNRAGAPTTELEQWLLSKKGVPNELNWYLEIDSVQHEPASCTVSYDGRDYRISILEDMTIGGAAGNCLSLSSSGYWLRIANSCMGKNLQVSCDKDFVTTLIYQKSGGETIYVLPITHSAPSLGTTTENVTSACFKTGTGCDYEGTLWAALALRKLNKEISDVLPYLTALADDNKRYFPSAFLYSLTSDEEYFSQIIQERKQAQFWEFSGNGYNRFYDTGIGMLALGSSSTGNAEIGKTQQYLLQIQTREGCWNNNNIRDTGFVLYAGWPRVAGTGISQGASPPSCIEAGYSCEQLSACTEAGGSKREGYICSSGLSICCSKKIERVSCAAENGHLCSMEEECDVATFEASDGACCLGICRQLQSQENQCEQSEGVCRASCGDSEIATNDQCTGNDVCCATNNKTSGISWIWILILLILIVIVVIAILYRDALRVWWFKQRGRASSTPVMRPGSPPPGSSAFPQQRGMSQRPVMRSAGTRQPQRPPAAHRDAELDETLRKLREMSK